MKLSCVAFVFLLVIAPTVSLVAADDPVSKLNIVIIDNPDADFLGKWYSGTENADQHGSDYRFAPSSDGELTAVAAYRPKNIAPGTYDVEIWYSAAENRSPNAHWVVWHDGRRTVTRVNQQLNGGKWIRIADSARFVGSPDESIFVSNFGTKGTAVIADAVRLIPATAAPTTQSRNPVTLDNEDATFEGDWAASTATSQRHGKDYRFSVTATHRVSATAIYRPNIKEAGRYDVEIFYAAGPNRSTASCWIIAGESGTFTNRVNQKVNGAKWLKIGNAVYLNAGTNGYVKLTNEASDSTRSVVVADAVRFVPVK